MTERDELRQIFFECWRKHKEKLPLMPLETQLVNLILLHPEYHSILDDPENAKTQDFGEHNPFLHLGLHLALHEQITTDRPAGIKEIYLILCKKTGDEHLAAHKMLDCLGRILWEAQQSMKIPDEKKYLELLRDLSFQF